MAEKKKLSLCMIVKNEEKFLAQCLDSVKDIVDEMIIVDTGSTDKTVEIAERYNAQIYHHPWEGSFSKARNISLQYATGEWILQLDADEKLERDHIPLLLNVVQKTKVNAVFLPLLNDLPHGGTSKHYFPRLFRNGKAYFEGIVHNQLRFEGSGEYAEVLIYHYGYNLSADDMERKYERSKELLLQQVEENPDNFFAWHNLVRIYRNQNKLDLVIKTVDELIARFDIKDESDKNIYMMLIYDAAVSAFARENMSLAEKYCHMALKHNEDYLDVLYVQACIKVNKQDTTSALSLLQQCLNLSEKFKTQEFSTSLKLDLHDSLHLFYRQIGLCYMMMNNQEKAIEYFQKAIEYNPDYQDPRNLLANLYYKNNQLDKAKTEFEHILFKVPDHVGAIASLIAIYLNEGDVTKGRSLLEKMVNHNISDTDLLHHYGDLCVQLGDFKLAIEFLEKAIKRRPNDARILNNIANCYVFMENYQSAVVGFQAANQLNPNSQIIMKNLLVLKEIIDNSSLEKLSALEFLPSTFTVEKIQIEASVL